MENGKKGLRMKREDFEDLSIFSKFQDYSERKQEEGFQV